MSGRIERTESYYQVIEIKTGRVMELYASSMASSGDTSWPSIESARSAQVRGAFKDRARYRVIKRTRVIVDTLDCDDCDPATSEEIEVARIADERKAERDAEWEAEKLRRGIKPKDRGVNGIMTTDDISLEIGGRCAWELGKQFEAVVAGYASKEAQA